MDSLVLRAGGLLIGVLSALLGLCALAEPAFAQKEKRLALIIGHSGYQHVPKLPNPLNDAKLQSDLDVEDESLSLDRVVKALEPAKRLRLIILDACRDNPFLKTMTRTIASRQVTNGLAKVEPDTDTLIAFAAKAGSTADDGIGNHSPFTVALLNNLFEPGIDIRIALGRVRDEVKRATGNKQEPFVYGSLGGSTMSLVPAPETKLAPAPAADPHANIRRDYELAAQIGTKEAWDSFLEVYKTGFFAELAKAARSKIIAADRAEAAAAEQKAKAEAAEKARAANAAAERAKAETARIASEAAERARAESAEKARAEAARQQEQARKAEEARQAEEARKAEIARKAEEAKKAEEARRAQEAQAREAQQAAEAEKKFQVAAVPANANDPDVTRSLQTELRRVGCHLGAIDGKWNPVSQRSLESFNRHAGMKLEAVAASADALDAVKAKTSRICPLTCERGFRADGERCVAMTCPRGEVLNSSGSCEARPKAAAKPEPKRATRDIAPKEKTKALINDIPCDRGLHAFYSNSCASDIRLKRDIVLVGRLDNGISLYSFCYLWSEEVYVGVMAQEVAGVVPGAVGQNEDGYLFVNYGMLGIRFQTLDQWRGSRGI